MHKVIFQELFDPLTSENNLELTKRIAKNNPLQSIRIMQAELDNKLLICTVGTLYMQTLRNPSKNVNSKMAMKKLIHFLQVCLLLMACDSTRTLYSSSMSKSDYWKLTAFTMSHCGCTELFADVYADGKHTSQIWYTNEFAQKNIFSLNDKAKIVDTLVLIAVKNDPEIAFDSFDEEIFRTIRSKVEASEGIVYEIKWTEYKGFKKKE